MLTYEEKSKSVEAIAADLAKLDGCWAQLWSYAVGLETLTIRLKATDSSKRDSYVVCRACEMIALPSAWDDAQLRLELEGIDRAHDKAKRSGHGPRYRYRMTDAASEVVIYCGGVHVFLETEPVY